ncbi:MAG: hypothetical protein AcusKO_26310 [Acuticoccus sp.]
MTDATDTSDARRTLVERLFKAFAKQLSDIEARIAQNDGDSKFEDTRILSGLAKTLETLVSVERKVGEVMDGGAMDLEAIRTELAGRLAELGVGIGGNDDAALADPA